MRDARGQLTDGLEFLGLGQLPLEYLDMRYVLGHVSDSKEISHPVLHRRESQEYGNRFTRFGEPYGLHMVDALTAPQPAQKVCVLGAPVRWHERGHGPAGHLFR